MALYVYGFAKWRSYIYDKTIFHSRGEPGASSRGQQGDSWQSGRKIPGPISLKNSRSHAMKNSKPNFIIKFQVTIHEKVSGLVSFENVNFIQTVLCLQIKYIDISNYRFMSNNSYI